MMAKMCITYSGYELSQPNRICLFVLFHNSAERIIPPAQNKKHQQPNATLYANNLHGPMRSISTNFVCVQLLCLFVTRFISLC